MASLSELENESNGKFTWEIVDPEAGDGQLARSLAEDYGMQPMRASLFDANQFYYYLTMTDGEILVTMQLPESEAPDAFKRLIEEGLKRFSIGLLSNVAIHKPDPFDPQMPQMPQMPRQPQGSQFNDLESYLSGDFDVRVVELEEPLNEYTDILIVAAPENLTSKELFMIDQYLMRGGTVVVASGAFKTTVTQQSLSAMPVETGMSEWLAHHGVTIENSMVLDARNSAFPLPVTRTVGNLSFQEIRMMDYPYFVEIQSAGMGDDNPLTNNLNQLTLAWSSPLEVDAEKNKERSVSELIRSSDTTWTETVPDVMPRYSEDGSLAYLPGPNQESKLLGVALTGKFTSFFAESPLLEEPLDEDTLSEFEESPASSEEDVQEDEVDEDDFGVLSSVISQSPESAKLLVFSSSDFLSDQTIRMISAASGSLYSNTLQLVANVVDWTVEDSSLLTIRGRGHFNRTLPPMVSTDQRLWEYGNYVLALLGIFFVFLINNRMRVGREKRYRTWLGADT